MIVFYSGYGVWNAKKIGSRKLIFGNETRVFALHYKADVLNLKYRKKTKAMILKPCYEHPDGATLAGFGKTDSNVFFIPQFKDKNSKSLKTGAFLTVDDIVQEQHEHKPHGNSEINAKKRQDVLGAALSVLANYPDKCKNKQGKIVATEIAKLIDEKYALFWPTEKEPPLSPGVIERLIRKWLNKTGD